MRSTIICVDDEKMLLNILAEQLTQWFGTRYTIEKALSGEDALQILDECLTNNEEVSLVISDYVMPGMRGDELLNKVTKRDPRIRKIMLTGYSSVEGIANAINNGGLYRYITKPWDTKDLMLTIVEAIRSYETEKKNADLTKGFEAMYKKYEGMYLESQRHLEEAIDVLSLLPKLREPNRAWHVQSAAAYMKALLKRMNIPEAQHKQYEQMIHLHEIGAAGLTDIELALLRKSDGKSNSADLNKQLLQKLNTANRTIIERLALPGLIKNAIIFQYERLDGGGPLGLSGANIPQEAFMLSLVCFYAERKAEMESNQAYSKETAMRLMHSLINKSYPSDLVLVFVEVLKAEFAN